MQEWIQCLQTNQPVRGGNFQIFTSIADEVHFTVRLNLIYNSTFMR